jgi:hypothetical protein
LTTKKLLISCLSRIAIAGFVKLLGGKAPAETNVAVGRQLTGVFYLLAMVIAVAISLSLVNLVLAFTFLIMGSIGYLVYFPIILSKFKGLVSHSFRPWSERLNEPSTVCTTKTFRG